MATSKKTRVFMGVLALLFIFTSSALTIAVIVQSAQSNKKNKQDTSQNAAIQKALQQAKDQSKEKKVQLQGTKLAGFTPVSSISELQKIDTVPGTGQEAKAGDTVTVDYTGAVASTGIVFQSSLDSGQPVPLTLKSGPGGVIDGWVQGLPGMKVGGTRRLLIPSQLAYGANPPSGIPANADLVFDITLHKIGK
jgi:FKBP-type peptidyl-prolyl cis-trans isomerase